MAQYDFRELTARDLPLLRRWMDQPHVAEWWGDPDTEIASIREHITSDEVEPLIVELNGKPIAYLQSYDPHLEDGHPYQDQPFGTLGLDLSIGPAELLGQGHGAAILRQFAEQLFEEGAPCVVIDPHPDNKRAISAYEKAGFLPIGRRDTPWGQTVLMRLDSPEDVFGDDG